MAPVVFGILLALGAAAAVLVLSAVLGGSGEGRPLRQFVTDLRGGLRRDDERPRTGLREELRDLAEDDDASVDELFTIGRADTQGYVDAEELSETLARAGRAVRGGVGQIARR